MTRTLEGVELVADVRALLGEGPVWDPRSGRLAWVDIMGRRINLTDPVTGLTESIDTPSDVGSIAARRKGGWVAALTDGFWTWDEATGWQQVAAVGADDETVRFNDGKADPQGRFWAGSMGYDQQPGRGKLYRLDPETKRADAVLDDVAISNGLVFTDLGRTLYYIDTPTQRIDVFRVTPEGRLEDRRTWVEIPAEAGSPDGMTMDTEGGFWVALWGGSAVHRYVDGKLDAIVKTPVTQPSSVAFGGRDLDELYITSAQGDLSPAELEPQPLAGSLFRIRSGFRGTLPDTYAG